MIRLIYFIALALAPAFAFAGLPVDLSPPATDQSVVWLSQIFGPVGSVLPGSPTIAGDLFQKLNIIALLGGTALAAYGSLVGTMATAHDGELLGKKWSSMWVPVRFAAGSALLMPTAGGYSAVQALVMWIALQGVGGADALWQTGADWFSRTGTIAAPHRPDAYPLAAHLLQAQVCTAVLNYEDPEQRQHVGPHWDESTMTLAWGGDEFGKAICGGVKLNPLTGTDADADAVALAHQQALGTLIADLQPLAVKMGTPNQYAPSDIPAAVVTVRAAADKYANSIQIASDSVRDRADRDGLSHQATTDGWALAGAYWWRLADQATKSELAVQAMPELLPILPLSINALPPYWRSDFEWSKNLAEAVIQEATPPQSRQQPAEVDGTGGTGWDWVIHKMSAPFLALSNAIADAYTTPGINPLMRIRQTGDAVLTAVDAIIGGLVAINVVGAFPGLKEGTAALTPIITWMLILPLSAAGIALKIIIPAIPATQFLTAVAGWIINVVEAMAAAPLWAASHLWPEGDDHAGAARPGYSLMISLLMRPVLLVLGLMLAEPVVEVLLQIINSTFMPTLTGIAAGGIFGPLSFVGSLILLTTMLLGVVGMAFRLPAHLADNVLAYVGGIVSPSAQSGGIKGFAAMPSGGGGGGGKGGKSGGGAESVGGPAPMGGAPGGGAPGGGAAAVGGAASGGGFAASGGGFAASGGGVSMGGWGGGGRGNDIMTDAGPRSPTPSASAPAPAKVYAGDMAPTAKMSAAVNAAGGDASSMSRAEARDYLNKNTSIQLPEFYRRKK